MEYTSAYSLTLPSALADVLASKIEEHMNSIDVSVKPEPAEFDIPGVLNIANVVMFTHLVKGKPSGDQYARRADGHMGRFDPDGRKTLVEFIVVQAIAVLPV